MRTAALVIVIGMMGGGLACPTGGQAVAPTAAAASDEVAGLIAKLADADFHVRRDASTRLREIGQHALPALREAAQGRDPEIRARAAELVHVLEYQPVPGRPNRNLYSRQRSVSTRIVNGKQTVEIDDEGRKISLSEDEDGIRMTVSGETNGKPVTKTYTARTPEQLQADNPEAFAVYQRFAQAGGEEGQANGNVVVQQNGNVLVVQRFQPPPIFVGPVSDDLSGLRDRVDQAMDAAKLSQDQRTKVHDAIDRVEDAQGVKPAALPVGEEDEWVAQYDKACDELRKVLKDNQLPDPGDAIPPPKSARLGISVQPDPLSGALTVRHVLPHSRADLIGLQDDDVVHKINGQEVQDVKDLRRLVTEHPKDLVVDVTRDGRDVRLELPK